MEFELSDSQKLSSRQTTNHDYVDDDDDGNYHNLSIFKLLLHPSNDPRLYL